ncbi:hypothetical protein HU200_016377 [Digitaria exilis]|uniref:F-box domain-containing protein n=1 Tax=Digitaria exilis TaxID=1010633 RepID=A0A835KJU4_9POAL|nr:hypothetical protein HU200_016377 [Digitaria exilis]CAB3455582.1 unnamed protein product [Digitaria exilis]
MAPPSRRPHSPPPLMEELMEEILLRVPPDEPAHLFRMALVCKPWRRILSNRGFLRRYRTFHRAPPLLGYLHNLGEGPIPPFVSTTAASLFSPPPLGGYWWALDCRHGRVLIHSRQAGLGEHLVVWDPISGDTKRIGMPPYPDTSCAGAVLCAVDGCDHLDCHDGPFLVVFVGTDSSDEGPDTCAVVYSSETGVWGASVSTAAGDDVESKPSLLIGDALYFTLQNGVLKYDLGRHELSEIEPPGVCGSIFMEVEDGVLGFVAESDNCIYKWLWQADANGTGRWEKHMVMELETVLPRPARCTSYEVIALVEGTDAIFVSGSVVGVFTLDLKSKKVNWVGKCAPYYVILPYRSFYPPDLAMGRLSLE